MAAKLKYAFLCDGAMLVHGKWTYQGIFSVINCVAFPSVQREAVLGLQFIGPVGPHALRLQFVDSKGKQITPEMRQPIECREFMDTTVTANLQGLPLPSEGFYSFKIFLDEEREPFGIVEFRANLVRPNAPPPE